MLRAQPAKSCAFVTIHVVPTCVAWRSHLDSVQIDRRSHGVLDGDGPQMLPPEMRSAGNPPVTKLPRIFPSRCTSNALPSAPSKLNYEHQGSGFLPRTRPG